MSATLDLAEPGEGSPVYLCEEEPVEPGQVIEVRVAGGPWVSGAFDWDGDPSTRPSLEVTLAGSGKPRCKLGPLPESALARWPRKGGLLSGCQGCE